MTEPAASRTEAIAELIAEPLTAEAFAPFGEVIESSGPSVTINQGYGERFLDLATVDVGAEKGLPHISRVRALPETAPVKLRLVERHPLGSQAFIPLDGQRYIVVVAPAGDPPDQTVLRAFLANGSQGVNYHRNVWHHPMIALDSTCEFLVVDRKGPGDNLDESEIRGGDIQVRL